MVLIKKIIKDRKGRFVKGQISWNKLNIIRKELEELYNNKHLSIDEIGKIFNCSDVTIISRLNEYKIKFIPYYKGCVLCGNIFRIDGPKSHDKRFCSKYCANKDYYQRNYIVLEFKPITKICSYCHKEFQTDKTHPYRTYCTENCANVHYITKNKSQENKIRKEQGLPLIGEGFMNEMRFLFFVHKLFGNYEILTHHRKWNRWSKSSGLELDIYIPELKLAFEYMGIQHYSFKHFKRLSKCGTETQFESQRYRDRCKKKLCKLKGITLIRIKYDKKLSEELILSKLKYFPEIIAQRTIK